MTKSATIISIEANIGAGKSTLIKNLQTFLDPTSTICIREPIDQWDNFRDPATNLSLLELYYLDPKKYALSFQTMIYSTLFDILQKTIKESDAALMITERSLQSSDGIFAKMLCDSEVLSPIEYQVYKNCIANTHIPLDVCIYLRTDPETCYERVQHRNRGGENQITIDYLRKCHDAHETWISSKQCPKSTFIIEVGTKTPDEIVSEVLDILREFGTPGGIPNI
jgi:deoxyadenosine/deoxycytidine kinase